MKEDDLLIGTAIFLMAEYGARHPADAFGFSKRQPVRSIGWCGSSRQGLFVRPVGLNKDVVLPWLQRLPEPDPTRRRFASETLRR